MSIKTLFEFLNKPIRVKPKYDCYNDCVKKDKVIKSNDFDAESMQLKANASLLNTIKYIIKEMEITEVINEIELLISKAAGYGKKEITFDWYPEKTYAEFTKRDSSIKELNIDVISLCENTIVKHFEDLGFNVLICYHSRFNVNFVIKWDK